jgi:hypothetical protein
MDFDRRRLMPLLFLTLVIAACSGGSNGSSTPVTENVCQRYPAGSVVQDPPTLFSHNGVLTVNLT